MERDASLNQEVALKSLLLALDANTWIAVAAALAAIVAAVSSWATWRVNKLQFELSNKLYAERLPRLVPYLVSARKFRDRQGTSNYVVQLMITNPTDADNSLFRIELRIDYLRAGRLANLILPAQSSPKVGCVDPVVEPVVLPLFVGAHGAISGSALFSLDAKLLEGAEIRSHKLLIHDAHSEICTCELITITEMLNPDDLEKNRSNTT
jgi:hypothetical protein